MNKDRVVTINLKNAQLVAKGIYINLHCPKCNEQSSEAYFTRHKQEEKYGIWFECQNCGNVEHISCRGKPEGYDPNRISKKFQDIDERAWNAEK